MTKIISALLCISLILAMSACKKEANDVTTIPSTPTNSPTVSTVETTKQPATEDPSSAIYEAPLSAVSLPVVKEPRYAEDQTLLSIYTYPDVSVILPDADVAELVTQDLKNHINTSSKTAESIHTAANLDYDGQDDWFPYFCSISYEVVRLDPNILSLFGTESSYDGNLRGSSSVISHNYDLTTGKALELRNIFYDDYSADILCELIIAGLSDYSEDSLFFDYQDVIRERFSTNVPVEAWYFSENGLNFYFEPYEIASYAMGTIVSEVPYEQLSGLLKDEYFPGEKLTFSGSITVQEINSGDETALEPFTQFGDSIVEEGAGMLLLHTNGSVSNVKIYSKAWDSDTNEFSKDILIYATAGIGPSDAILMEASTATAADGMYVTYESDGQLVTLRFTTDSSGNIQLTN